MYFHKRRNYKKKNKTEMNTIATSVNDYKALKPSQKNQEKVLHLVPTCTTLVESTGTIQMSYGGNYLKHNYCGRENFT